MPKISYYKRKKILPEIGTKLRIKKRILPNDKCGGFLVKQHHIDVRRPGEEAEYAGYVPGAGGDIWWVRHQDGSIGAYTFDEITNA